MPATRTHARTTMRTPPPTPTLALPATREQPEKTEETPNTRERLAGMGGTSTAFYDLDSDGYGMKSRESVKQVSAADISALDKALKEKARFTAELAGRLFQALQAHLMALPPEARRETLDKAMLEMVGQKKRLEAERAFLSDQLTQVRLADGCWCWCGGR